MNIKKWMYSKDTCSLTKHLFSPSCTWPQLSALHLWKGQLEPINEVCTENVFIFILSYLFIIDDLRGEDCVSKRVVSFCLLGWICNFFNHQHHVSGHSLLNPLCTHSASEEVRVTWLSGASNLYDFVVFFCLFGVTRSKSKRSKLCCKKTNMSFMKELYPNIWPQFWYNNGRTEWLRDVCPAQLPVLF